MSEQYYRLPDGSDTTDTSHYIDQWGELTRAIEHILGARVYAFDPDVGVSLPDGSGSFNLPLWAAQKIVALTALDELATRVGRAARAESD